MSVSKKSKREVSDLDLALALELQQEYNPVGLTENAVFPEHKNKENYQPRTLIDQTLEIIDPTPNIHTLFMQFNTRFFSNKLLSVEVKWSKRMTSCAGVCSFHPRSRDCVISLSAPLLKLRPRKDLVETLLHEMIHGFLFLTNNNRDRDGHGPEFCKHMNRINKEAGTSITIYHSFHDEVKLYQQHWWRCNGPCQKQHPYFGTVRRSMNRAPGPSDFWWKTHQQNCGGEFIKVKEPENFKGKSKGQKAVVEKKKPPSNSANGKHDKNLDDFFRKPQVNSTPASTSSLPASSQIATKTNGSIQPFNPFGRVDNHEPRKNVPSSSSKVAPAGLVKLGTATNNVHGWGTGGPGSSSGKSPSVSKNKPTSSSISNPGRALNFAGTVGGVATGRSNLLDKFSSPPAAPTNRPPKKPASTIIIDSPPVKKPKLGGSTSINVGGTPAVNDSDLRKVCCPICEAKVPQSRLNDHLDDCLASGSENNTPSTPPASSSNNRQARSVIVINSSPETPELPRSALKAQTSTPKIQSNLDGFVTSPKKTATKHVPCPVCDKSFEMQLLNEHLDNCLTQPKTQEDGATNQRKERKPPAGPSSKTKPEKIVDLTVEKPACGNSYVCLVCNLRISGDIALNDHLDECVQKIFNDDSIVDEYNSSINSSPGSPIENDTFPCPICMQPVPEKRMDRHLDGCLSSVNWN